ncbi:mitochondrial genome maintenance MGM101-domain-containing protein [Infundibulicybe gibba]|nr:mitochondrial genome maintenance MGM101-domain-containing protein [Infundibulicybe gibba]
MASLAVTRLTARLSSSRFSLLRRSVWTPPTVPKTKAFAVPRSAAAAKASTVPTTASAEDSAQSIATESDSSIGSELNVRTSEIPPSAPAILPELNEGTTDWSKSYHGLSTQAFSKEIAEILLAPVDSEDIEMKPDGLIYLPEIKYRRVLNKAFGPGAWGLAPRSETNVGPKIVSREYALVCQGRLVAIARGEQEYFDPSGIPTATEACKSNALMRCCKDLGIASELWDPRFIREFKAKYCIEVFAEHIPTKKKKKLWRRKDQPKFSYPYQE